MFSVVFSSLLAVCLAQNPQCPYHKRGSTCKELKPLPKGGYIATVPYNTVATLCCRLAETHDVSIVFGVWYTDSGKVHCCSSSSQTECASPDHNRLSSYPSGTRNNLFVNATILSMENWYACKKVVFSLPIKDPVTVRKVRIRVTDIPLDLLVTSPDAVTQSYRAFQLPAILNVSCHFEFANLSNLESISVDWKQQEGPFVQYTQTTKKNSVTLHIQLKDQFKANFTFFCFAKSPFYLGRATLKQISVLTGDKLEPMPCTSSFPVAPTSHPSTNRTSLIIALTALILILAILFIFGTGVCILRSRKPKRSESNISDEKCQQESKQTKTGLIGHESDCSAIHSHVPKISQTQITLQKQLGRGYFGVVFKGIICTKNGHKEEVAVKMPKDDTTSQYLINEIKINRRVGKHENVLHILGICKTKNHVCAVMPYACNGSLLSYLHLKRLGNDVVPSSQFKQETLSDMEMFQFALQVAKGMAHLASQKCVHRDLAARNVLVFEKNLLKVSDFGLAKDDDYYAHAKKKSKSILPLKWTAPETLIDKLFSEESDVWSFGILCWEIATLGGSPYPGVPIERLYDLLMSSYRLGRPRGCSTFLYTLMCSCWNGSPSTRPKFSELQAAIACKIKSVNLECLSTATTV